LKLLPLIEVVIGAGLSLEGFLTGLGDLSCTLVLEFALLLALRGEVFEL